MTEQRAATDQAPRGEVVAVDYDADTVAVRLDDGSDRTFAFEPFDSGDVYREGQRFELALDEDGGLISVRSLEGEASGQKTVSGYVESVDRDDELVWVYVREEEGWQRKVMPLQLFLENDLARPGQHFLLKLDENGTPVGLESDEVELEMLPQSVEETKPRWTNRPAAEAEPES